MRYQQLALIGDSITEFSTQFPHGLHTYLNNEYVKRLDVINRGYSGYNTRILRAAYKDITESLDSTLAAAVLFIGTNDSVLPGELQHVPIAEFKENMLFFIENLQKVTDRIVLITPAYISEALWPGRTNEFMDQYIEAIEIIGKDKNIPVINLKKVMKENPDLLLDGLHFNDDGFKAFVPKVLDALATLDLDPEKLKYKLPYWRDLADKPLDTVEKEITDHVIELEKNGQLAK